MALMDIFAGDHETLREAERQLVAEEDRVFRPVPGEDKDLALHVQADIPRFATINIRQRVGDQRSAVRSDRNLFFTLIGLGAIGAKVFGVFDLFLKAIASL